MSTPTRPQPEPGVYDIDPATSTVRFKTLNPPGMSGDSSAWEGWSHVREYVEEVSGRAA